MTETRGNGAGMRRILGDALLSASRPAIAIAAAFVVSAGLILAVGANPLQAYAALLAGSVGSKASLAVTAVRTTPLLLAGLGVAIGFKAGVFNVGSEGQIYAGGAAAVMVALMPLPLPGFIHAPLAVLAGFLGGAVWALLPGYLRAYRGISEVVITLMMNYIGIYFVSWLVHGPIAEPGAPYPQTHLIQSTARLPILLKGTSMHAGILIGLILGVVLYIVLHYTPYGFRLRMVGTNPDAARFAGVNGPRQILTVMLISGGMGGLAGAAEILGLRLRLFDFFSGGLGYDAIAVALLGNSNPLGVIVSAVFFGALRAGANRMQQTVGIEASIAVVIQALAVLFVIGMGFRQRARAKAKRQDKSARAAVGAQSVGEGVQAQ